MTHRIARHLISALIDGELHVRQAARVEVHVIQCVDCRDLWVSLVHLVRRVSHVYGDKRHNERSMKVEAIR